MNEKLPASAGNDGAPESAARVDSVSDGAEVTGAVA